jgi:ParB-like chromosome segregation protein Spo0J
VAGPDGRKPSAQSRRDLLRGIRDVTEAAPIIVFRHPGALRAKLVAGTHRWRVSAALGFPMISCWHRSRDEAHAYGLP